MLQSEILSVICAKLRTVAASNSSHAMITLLFLVRATYMYGVVLLVHPIHGKSHNQHNTTGGVATVIHLAFKCKCKEYKKNF